MRPVISLLIALSFNAAAADVDVETQCLDCHRAGASRGEVPIIEGQQREYLEHQLLRFRDRHRISFPMSGLVGGARDASLQRMALALSERDWPRLPLRPAPDAAQRGAQAVRVRDCTGCHGAALEGSGDIPRLAGQHPGYLARQILGFGRGERFHPPSGTGAPMHTIGADEADDLAAYFSQARPAPPDTE